MTKKEIISNLEGMNALRVERERVSILILQDATNLQTLLTIVFDVDNKIAIKAAWIFEIVCENKITWLYPHLNYFTQNLKKVHFDSAVRPLSKVCKVLIERNNKTPILNFTENHTDLIIEATFDWLIGKYKVATKAYAMITLYHLGKKTDWIHKELELIIESNMDKESAAYKSRGRITLEQIKKFKKKG